MTVVTDARLPELLAGAVAATASVVRRVRSSQYSAPTPCTEMDVRGLLNHLIGGQRYFAATAAGQPADFSVFSTDYLIDGEPAKLYEEESGEALAFFAAADALTRRATMPNGATGPLIAQMYLIEQVMHGWDVAAATGQDRSGDPQAVQAAYDGWYGHVPQQVRDLGTVFGPEQPCPDEAPIADRLAAYLGRRIP